MEKRISARAIIIENEKIFLMFRRKNGRSFYAFPGGKKEETETLEECVKRELIEELGIEIEPNVMVYEFHSKSSVQYFFLSTYKDGIFGTGTGEEFDKNPKNNYYEPRQEYLYKMEELEIMPNEIKTQLIADIKSGDIYNREKPLKIIAK